MRSWKFNHIDFSTYAEYSGDDLGVFWSPEKTVIKIWAPTAKQVELRLYKEGIGGDTFYKTKLVQGEKGTWSAVLKGDYEGKFYTLRINDGEWLDEVPDIYARCVGINGKRGMIYHPEETDPARWDEDRGPELQHYTDAILYELHVRDFSISSNSGIINKGKYIGFTEEDTKNPAGLSTGVSHLKELGITHVHLLPVSDFATIDEEKPFEKYNWGYDPMHYNALEGSYSSDPRDGRVRIKEFKKLVRSLHDNGIGVILDVVYNHTYFAKESVFSQTVPGYFYRQKKDGGFANASGCGNEIASERGMVRKYIVDSLKYWAREFHIDGFRFDLMGILDTDTMNLVRKELDSLGRRILLYGEGWTADKSPMPEQNRAVKLNVSQMPGVAAFNDDFRDALKGNHGSKRSKGFVCGLELAEEPVKFGIVGATHHPQIVYDYVKSSPHAWAQQPGQCINYVSCHDNYTLWDKLKMSCQRADEKELKKRVKLALALVLTSQGIPFLHAGVEMCRTKMGHGNSYKMPDAVNQIDWNRKTMNKDVAEYTRQLIELRKNHPAFRIPTAEMISESLKFCTQYKMGVVSYCIDGKQVGDSWGRIVLLFNANSEPATIPLPEGSYAIIANGEEINENGIGEMVSDEVTVQAASIKIIVENQ